MEIGGAPGRASRCFWQLPKAATGAASASNRATTGGWPLPNTIYTRKERDLAASAEDGAARELISHQAQPVSNRDRLWMPQERNPLLPAASNGPGTELWRRVQDRTSSSFASIHAR